MKIIEFGELPVSIHASRTGGDFATPTAIIAESFQSTPPAREATRPYLAPDCINIVSIHASRTGGDRR